MTLNLDPGFLIGLLLVVLFIWLFPIYLILRRSDVSAKEKAIWIFAVFFVTWLAWILFLFIAPVIEDAPAPDRRTAP